MFLVIPLVIQIQGNEVRIGIAGPPQVVNQSIPGQDHSARIAPRPSFGPAQLRRMLQNPSLN